MFSSSSIQACRLALLGSLTFAVPSLAQTWTEARVLELFARQSPQAEAARARIAVTRADASGRGLYGNPSFSYSREGAGSTEFFQAEMTLPLTGRIGILRQAVAPSVGAAEAEAEALIWELRTEVRLAFYRLLALQDRQEVLNATIRDLQEVIRVLAAREKEGEGSRFDRLRWEREIVEIRVEQALVQAQSSQARSRMLEFLPDTEIAKVEGAIDPVGELPGLAELLTQALASRSEIRADNQLAVRLRLEQLAAGRLRYPEPVLAGGLKRAGVIDFSQGRAPVERTESGVSFGITIPIPSFNRGQGEVARLGAEQTRLEAHRRALEHQVRAQVAGAFRTLHLRRQAIDSYRRELGERNEELMRIARTAYEEGETGILELLDVFRLRRQSEQRLIELGSGTREAWIELERAMGREVTK
ncbi:MAG: TolC family protein [Bryobacterales bacterium]|nr:TolC family protein [Bryobacterales bacterium]